MRLRLGVVLAATAAFVLLVGAGLASGATPPFTQCPAVGLSSSCAILVTINADRSVTVFSDPSVGLYDGGDDTLIGVQNNSTSAVDAITVTGPGSGLGLLDGDGLCSFGVVGCPFGPTGYEGPGTSIVTDPTISDSAEIDFSGGLQANHSAYFSLEGVLTSAQLTARQGHLKSLNLSVRLSDVPLIKDPTSTTPTFKIAVTVTDENGNPVPSAAVTAAGPVPLFQSGTTGSDGQTSFVVPYRGDGNWSLNATAGGVSGSALVNLYSISSSGFQCSADGAPSQFTPLLTLLSFALPSGGGALGTFKNWLDAIGLVTGLKQSQERSVLTTFTVNGSSGLTNLYALQVRVEKKSDGTVVSRSIPLFSRSAALIQKIAIQSGGGISALFNNFHCGVPA